MATQTTKTAPITQTVVDYRGYQIRESTRTLQLNAQVSIYIWEIYRRDQLITSRAGVNGAKFAVDLIIEGKRTYPHATAN